MYKQKEKIKMFVSQVCLSKEMFSFTDEEVACRNNSSRLSEKKEVKTKSAEISVDKEQKNRRMSTVEKKMVFSKDVTDKLLLLIIISKVSYHFASRS